MNHVTTAAPTIAVLALPTMAADQQTTKYNDRSRKTYLLVAPTEADLRLPAKDVHWTVFHKWLSDSGQRLFKIVDRSQLDSELYLDTRGLRLYVSSPECRAAYEGLESDSEETVTLAFLIRSVLGKRIAETGIEPDRIPVRGEAGKKRGTERMVAIEGGQYERPGRWFQWLDGLTDQQGDRYRVKVSSFYLDKYKVTLAEYCEFLNDGNPGYWSPPGKMYGYPQLPDAITCDEDGRFVVELERSAVPVTGINWYQASGYAEWAGKRLPTEAEREFAAGGKHGYLYPWGNDPPTSKHAHILIGMRSVPGDTYHKGATPEGVFQMAGNSGEWCADYFDNASYRKAPPGGVAINPTGAADPFQPDTWYRYRVMFKGWCKANRAEYFTCTKRNSRPPLADAASGISFRCVKSSE